MSQLNCKLQKQTSTWSGAQAKMTGDANLDKDGYTNIISP